MEKLGTVFVLYVSVLTFALSGSTSFALGQTPASYPLSTSPGQGNTQQATVDDHYRIGFEDALQIQVFNHANLTQTVRVGANGTIQLFMVDHPVVAACKTERELASDIATAYRENYLKDPQVTVLVAEQKSQSVAVIGAVEKPGNFFITRRVHLLEVLAMAGGPNKEAGTRLIVARTGSTGSCKATNQSDDSEVALMDFKIRDIQQGKQALWMRPGDIVSVLDADIVYMYGNLMKQGPIKVRDPITLRQAIASAEGLKPATKKDHIRVLRQVPNSVERTELVFDLNQIDKGIVKDPYLESGDIVAVSEDKMKAIMNGITNAMKATVPGAAYRFP